MPLVREETEHLHRVLRELDARGGGIGFDLPNPYASGLLSHARSSGRDGRGYLDALLVSALIEMRSHERFVRLRACAATRPLHRLYDALGEAEARHGTLFLALALEAHDEGSVRERFDELARVESALLDGLDPGPRVHSGWRGL
ncbi:MAG: hypothetical protein H6825_12425 [Planctomycetes bacterium]|nr:hypothetical protein [Planctomycetota bacterium]